MRPGALAGLLALGFVLIACGGDPGAAGADASARAATPTVSGQTGALTAEPTSPGPATAAGPTATGPAATGPAVRGPAARGPAATDATASEPTGGTTATPKAVPRATWRVGATPLPTRADGFGAVLPTPPELRVRRLATADLLPPPPGGVFRSAIAPIGPAIRRRMGETWRPGCPVTLADLRYLTVSFRGFDGRAHTGELIVHARVARDVAGVFRRLYAARFPIEQMRLVTTADLHAPPTGDGNNTAAFVCRTARQQGSWSAHAYGLAVDVNPFQNPYRRGDLVLPELASSYLDRSWRRPGMVVNGDVVTRAFAAIGWVWGGSWRNTKDPMHFSATGR